MKQNAEKHNKCVRQKTWEKRFQQKTKVKRGIHGTGKRAGLAQPSPAWAGTGRVRENIRKNIKKRYLEAKLGFGLDQGYPGWLEAGPVEPRLQESRKNGANTS